MKLKFIEDSKKYPHMGIVLFESNYYVQAINLLILLCHKLGLFYIPFYQKI